MPFFLGVQETKKYTFLYDILETGKQALKPEFKHAVEIANVKRLQIMDHSPINQNFELNKSRQKFHHSLKSITKLVIFQSFVAKCCKMRII